MKVKNCLSHTLCVIINKQAKGEEIYLQRVYSESCFKKFESITILCKTIKSEEGSD